MESARKQRARDSAAPTRSQRYRRDSAGSGGRWHRRDRSKCASPAGGLRLLPAPAAASRKRARSSSRSRSPVATWPRPIVRPRASSERPTAVFLMGLPGSGKSTIKRRRLHGKVENIEPDEIMRQHPRYSDRMSEATDETVHRWSVRQSVTHFEDLVSSRDQPDVVFDTSGTNAQWLLRRIRCARDNGYHTELLWVDVPLEVALFRNRNRATSCRGRGRGSAGQWCPEKVITDKADKVEVSYQALKDEVDKAEHFVNWKSDGAELREAKLDLFLYPEPRNRPPSLRPGDEGYGKPPPGARSPSRDRSSRRSLRIGPWKRSDEVMAQKTKRLAWMDREYRGGRERYIREEVLDGKEVVLEPNAFPYRMPPDIEHWTIWRERSMDHTELCRWIERWLDKNRKGEIKAWNYDDNRGARTIDVWHVHVYFQRAEGREAKHTPALCSKSPCSV